MTIELGNSLDNLDDEAFEEEDSTEYNMRELMDQVYLHKELIITIPTEQVNILKQGLITRKAKDNTKLKNNGILPVGEVLFFLVYPAKDGSNKEIEGVSEVRIKLGPKKSVNVLAIRIPNDEL